MPTRDEKVQALVEQLSADLDRSVLVDDASLRLLAYSPTLGSDDEVRKTAILTLETPQRELEVRLLEALLGDDAATRELAVHDLGSGDVLVAGATIGVLALRRSGDQDAE